MNCGNYDFDFKYVAGGMDLKCTRDINPYKSMLFMQMDSEMAMRLMNKGIFPINSNVNGVECCFYMKDINGLFIGTQINNGYLLRPNKPNNELSKSERKTLKDHNLL